MLDTGSFTFAAEMFRCEGEGSGIGRESWDEDYSTTIPIATSSPAAPTPSTRKPRTRFSDGSNT